MAAKYPHVVRAEKYAQDVISGKIVSCKWTRLACERHFKDKKKSAGKWKYKFDRATAQRVCEFAEKMPHIKGKWEGELIKLEPWQCFIFCMIFGWVRKDNGKRRFRKADIKVPRKNAKSTKAAIIGIYMLVADGEAGAEIYCGAVGEAQAHEVFRPARLMVAKSPDFQRFFGVVPGARSISQHRTNSFFKPLIGKPGDGASPSCHICDEYHEHDSDEQVDTMRTGMGAREQPLQLIITTAGDNISGPCFIEFEDAKKILEGIVENDEVFAILYTIDDDDDWTSEKALIKANPNLGVSVDRDFLLSEQKNAILNPRKQAIFKTKHLNVWVGALNAYFNIEKWRSCENKNLRLEDFYGRSCYIGLDLASKIDLAALEILFPPAGEGKYARFGKYYLPRATVQEASRDHYRSWEAAGRLKVTDGEIIDFDVIKEDLLELSSLFDVIEIGYDPWQATQLATDLMKEGAPVKEFRPNVGTMSEPMKTLDALIRADRIEHDGDPVATWCLSNVVAKEDAKENVYPRKSREENKIDAAVAMIMALGLSLATEHQGPSIYESQDIREL